MGFQNKVRRVTEVPHVGNLGDSMRQAQGVKGGAAGAQGILAESMHQGGKRKGKSVKGKGLGASMKQG